MSYSIPAHKKGILRLDLNESPRVNPFAVKAIGRAAKDINRYSDPDARELTAAIAEYVGVKPEWVLTFPGADVIIDSVLQKYGDTSVDWVSPEYGYWEESVKRRSKRQYDGVAYVSFPNNPTGSLPDHRVMVASGEQEAIIIDGAYLEFCSNEHLCFFTEGSGKIFVLRSFSKAFGMADVRLAYVVGQNVQELAEYRKSKNVSGLAQAAGIAALKHQAWMRNNVRKIVNTREWFCGKLKELRISFLPSHANFVLLRKDVTKYLLKHGIATRQKAGGTRITIGTQK